MLAHAERLEPALALPCAVALLLYPHPLAAPAALIGLLPSIARLAATGRPWPGTRFDLPLLLLLLGGLLGAAASLSAEGRALRLFGLGAGVILFAAAARHARSPRGCRWIVGGAAVAALLGTIALVAIVAPFLRLERVPGLADLARALDWWGLSQGLADEDALLRRFRLRASGVGALADVTLALLFAVAVGQRSWRRRLLVIPPAIFAVAVLFATDNRGSMLAGAVTLALLAAFVRPILLPLAPVAAAAVLGLLELGVVEKGLSARTIDQRFWFWENSLYLAAELPLTGAGLGTESVQLTYQTYFLPVYPNFSHAHNIYLQALLEQGGLGLVGLAGLTAAAVWAGIRARRLRPRSAGDERWRWAASLAGLGAALALFGTGLTEITAVSTIGSAILLGALGLLAAGDDGSRPNASFRPLAIWPSRGRGRRWAIAAIAAGFIALGLWATGLGARGAATVLLNAAAVDLNRAVTSEETTKAERGELLDRSIWLLRLAEDLDSANPSIPRNLAIALDARDDPRRGRAAADRAKALTDRADRRGMFQVGRAYAAIGAWGEAIRAWEAAEAGPQLVQLGNRLIKSRNWDQAVAAFRAGAILSPGSHSAYEGIGRAGRARSETADWALNELKPLVERGGDNAYYALLQSARLLREDGRVEEALETLRAAEAIHRDAELDAERGAALALAGRSAEAEHLLLAAIAARSDQSEWYYWLAVAQAAQGRHRDAVETTKDGLRKVEPNRAVEAAPLLARMGEEYLALGLPDEAEAAYRAGLAIAPDDPRMRDGLERAQAAQPFRR